MIRSMCEPVSVCSGIIFHLYLKQFFCSDDARIGYNDPVWDEIALQA